MSAFDLAGAAAALRARVEAARSVWVTMHESPDGDSIGAALAFHGILRRLGKQAVAIRQPPYPRAYESLPWADEAVDVAQLASLDPPDLILACDIGSFDRIGAVLHYVRPDTVVVNVDHHPDNGGPGKPCVYVDLVNATYASTTMLAFDLLETAWPGSVDARAADCLYVGLLTDTGCFRHSNTSTAALRVAAALAERGADVGHLAERYMFRRRPEAVQLLGRVLSSLRFHAGGRIATLQLSLAMLRDTGARMDETEGFVNYATSVEGVQAAVLLREIDPRRTRASLRSSGAVDVSRVARSFGGGGHRNAAGCGLDADLETAEARLVEALSHELVSSTVEE